MYLAQRLEGVRQELHEADARGDLRVLQGVENEIVYLRSWPQLNGLSALLDDIARYASAAVERVARYEARRRARCAGWLLDVAQREISRGKPEALRLGSARRCLVRAERLLTSLEGISHVTADRMERLREKLGLVREGLAAAELRVVQAEMVLGSLVKYRACDSKRAYTSEEEARAARKKYAYTCAFCGLWHTSSRRKSRSRCR